MIRIAYPEDVKDLVKLGEKMHAESIYRVLTLDRSKVQDMIVKAMDRGCCLVADIDGEIVGVMIGFVYEPWYSSQRVAFEEAFYILPEHRAGRIAARLIEAWENWSVERGARLLRPTTSCGGVAAERLYEHMKFLPVGVTYAKVV